MTSIFTKMVKGEIPCHKVLENEDYFAILDIKPINPGHCLVIPKNEIDYVFDLEDKDLCGLMIFAKKVAQMIKKTVPCTKVGIMVAGLEVRHTHIHLVPIFDIRDLNFSKAQLSSNEDLTKIAEQIRQNA